MPDPADTILDMIQRNPNAFAPQAQAQAQPQVDTTSPAFAAASQMEGANPNSWAAHRGARIRGALQNPDFQDSLSVHHNAVADTQAFDHASSTELGLYTAALIQHDTGAYHQAVHGIHASDPDYEDKMMQLAKDYPYAKPNAELMQPHHDARQTYVAATGQQAQRVQEREQQSQAKEAAALVGKGLVSQEEAQSAPSLGHLQMLAATREASRKQPALSPAEHDEWKEFNAAPQKYMKSVWQSTDSPTDKNYNPGIAAKKAVFWSAVGKMHPGAAQTGSPAASNYVP